MVIEPETQLMAIFTIHIHVGNVTMRDEEVGCNGRSTTFVAAENAQLQLVRVLLDIVD